MVTIEWQLKVNKNEKKRRSQCKQQDAFQHAEGVQYKSGAFHDTKSNKNDL